MKLPAPNIFRLRPATAGGVVVAVLLLAAGLLLTATPRPAPVFSAERALPFAVGERLVYHVEWNPPWWLLFLPSMEAGEATLNLAEETRYQNHPALRIVFTAKSSGTLVKLAGVRVDDLFEFITDPNTFCTYSVTKRIREKNRMRDIDIQYLPGSSELHMREIDVSVTPPQTLSDKNYPEIPSCVKDLFSSLYHVRGQKLETGSSYRVLVGDNQHVKEVEVRVGKKERISTPSGVYEAWRVDTVALLGGLFKNGGQFRMWLSADERKVPVKFEAKVSVGKVTGSLKAADF